MSERITVFVADDHPLYLEALEDAVRRRPDLEYAGGARDGRTALTAIQQLRPAVAVLDVRMSELDGAEVLNAIVRDELATRVILLSSYIDSSLVYDLLAQGAAGFLDKGASAEEICDAIVAVARGETVVSPRVEGGVLQQIRLRGEGSGPELTPRELDVLRLVAAGLSAPAIAARLLVEPSTVKSHLQNIYEKLGVSDRAAAVAEGMRRGLVE
jgi:two-component system nitrate/nitrite response regulator NarL